MTSQRGHCHVRIPDHLVEKMEQSGPGLRSTLFSLEKEFGLTVAWSDTGRNDYTLHGPNADILELALDTLEGR